MRGVLSFLLGFTLVIAVNGTLTSCNSGGGSSSPSQSSGVPAPNPGQWAVYAGNVAIDPSTGNFYFGTTGGAGQGIGYVYTGYNGNPAGKTITMTYTVGGSGTIVPAQAAGTGPAEVRLFLWRRGDDITCSNVTEWFRWWSQTGAGPLTNGTHTISATIAEPGWTDCFAHSDPNQLAGTTANLIGIGFTFGAEFFGHGVYSTGSNTFTLNSFTVQ